MELRKEIKDRDERIAEQKSNIEALEKKIAELNEQVNMNS